jgi:hypothetical protein
MPITKATPLLGDRAAYDALDHPSLHTNDVNGGTESIHHTLGGGTDEAARGSHGHEITSDSIYYDGIVLEDTPVVTDGSGHFQLGYTSPPALTNHDHESSGGTFNADHLTSGDSTDGYVLTSDGLGGSEWERNNPATHSHAGAFTGGTFNADHLASGAATDGQVLTADGAGGAAWEDGGGGGGHVIMDEGGDLTQRTNLDFVGGGVTVTDDAGADSTIVTIPGGAPKEILFYVSGTLAVAAGVMRVYNTLGAEYTIEEVEIAVNTTPAGSSITVDVHKGGTTIFTNQANRPSISAGAYTGTTTTIDIDSWADGEYLTLDVDAVGSGTAGANLTCMIRIVAT